MGQPRPRRFAVTIAAAAMAWAFLGWLAACSTGECNGDLDCPLDRVCNSGSCVVSCEYESARCASGQICVNGHCQAACIVDADCYPQVCRSPGICVSASGGDSSSESGDSNETGDSDTDAGTDG